MKPSTFHPFRPNLRIAWRDDGPAPEAGGPAGFFWLGGFMSDMAGTKAEFLADLAERDGRPFRRFDYSGHGASDGAFAEGTISQWLDEACAIFTLGAPAQRVLIGSSMGGWIALLLARRLAATDPAAFARIAGMVLIAPAADMTEDLMWAGYDEDTRRRMVADGRLEEPSDYSDEPYVITHALIEDGRKHLMLEDGLDAPFPIRILQGEEDADVPWQHALKVYRCLRGGDVSLTLVKGGDHRLSTPRDLATLAATVEWMCRKADDGQPG